MISIEDQIRRLSIDDDRFVEEEFLVIVWQCTVNASEIACWLDRNKIMLKKTEFTREREKRKRHKTTRGVSSQSMPC